MTNVETITYRQIHSLMTEAQMAGDHAQVALCEIVLAQDRVGSSAADDANSAAEKSALLACVAAIRAAEAQDDE